MPRRFNPNEYRRKMEREVNRVNRENKRRVDEYNRKAERHNQKVVDDYNRQVAQVNEHNRRADQQNRATIGELNRRLNAHPTTVTYRESERALANRVQQAISTQDDREWDVFLSYARIDGGEVGNALRDELEQLGVRVWFDEVAITPGKSQALQMDKGLSKARCGVAVVTAAYLTGRFWTERELGALLHKDTLVPVLDGVTFEQVREYSGILPDLAGFETNRDSVEVIAQKIASAVLPDSDTQAS